MSLISDIRVDIGDDGATQRFTDAQLIAILGKSVRKINRELDLADHELLSVTPSGELVNGDTAEHMYDLVLLQAECLLASRDLNSNVNGGGAGIYVVDGEQTLDTRGAATSRQAFLDSDGSPCKRLEAALNEEKLNRSADFGKLIW